MKKLVTPLTTIFLFVMFFLASSENAKASHAMGSDITYRCLGNNQYEVTFHFYRDCAGISAPDPMSLDIEGCGFPSQTVFLPSLPSSPTQITPICPSATSTCNGGTYTGIEEWVYQGIITLPGQCANWQISHSEGVRNSAITTITGAGSDNLFVYSTINNLNGICNDSPIFSNQPVPFACVGQLFCFNHGAYDAQGDSLSYQIITPRNGPLPTDTVTYLAGYSASQPVVSTVRPMSFSTINGDFCMYPTVADVTVLAILVNEYRNGVLIGQVERDIQVTVNACSNNLPSVTGINYTPIFAATVCAGNQLCFNIGSIDPDGANTTTITWDGAIPNATFVNFGAHRDSARFCWTPSSADISTSPYCFTVTVQDDNCPYLGVQVYSYCIMVIGVAPDAGPDQSVACGVTTTLNGSATGGNGVFNYLWDPGAINSQVLNGVGVGTYYLTVTSAGCTNVDTVQITAGLGVPVSDFNFSNSCNGTPAQFTDNSTVAGSTISSWAWDFGDGNTDNSQNPSHLYAANGTYNVTLTVSTPTNCTSTLIQQITINTNIANAVFAAPNVCDGFAMNFSDQSTGGPFNTWAWDFNDPTSGSNTSSAQNPTHTFTAAGTYNITLSVTNVDGCSSQLQQNVTVNANPVINVSDAGICEGSAATLNGPAGYSIYSWSSGQSTQSISVSPLLNTNYTLTVTDANGCVGNDAATVTVDPVPMPDAGLDQTICEGTNANLSGSSANGGTTYTWTPGNLSGQNVVVTPTTTTDYTLTVASNTGCLATDIIKVIVNPMPSATVGDDFGICKGESVTINSTATGGNIVWTPGNYNTQSITVAPTVTTTYYLFVSDAIGCSGADTITIVVNEIPVASIINPNPSCGNNSIQFTDASTVVSGSINSWLWDLGNGQFATSQNPVITYNTAANYNISLIVTTDGGCKDTTTAVQTIWATPVAAYVHTDACEGVPISFTDGSSISDASPLGYNWSLGDNSTSTSTAFTHLYASYGAYPAKLLVNSVNGCVDSITSLVNVYALPNAAFTVNYACEDQETTFNDASTIPQGMVSSWLWTFGDNNASVTPEPSHAYDNPGTYNIHLVIMSDHGCQDSTDGVIRVVPKPLVDFETQNACLGYSVDLTDHSQPVTGSIVQYDWNFGDGTTSSVQNPQHAYSSSGWFQVSLTATSDSGCSTTLIRPNALNIFPLPIAQFFSNASEANDIYPMVNFVNTTVNSSFYYWNFGDGDTSTDYSPTHLYPDVGLFDVQLTTIDHNGCIDSTLLRIEIKPTSNIYVPNAFTPNGDTRNDFFQVYSYNVISMEVQIYDRWGLKIVEWKDPKGNWDGKVNGNPAQEDTYVYRVSTVDVNDKKEVLIGHVSLVR